MSDKILLTIDGSTKSTGYAIFNGKKLISHGIITASSSNLFNRIEKMTNELNQLVKYYHPTRVVMEDVIPEDVKHNQSVYKALVYLQGFVRNMLNHYKLDAELIVASHWRAKCGIKTGAGVHRDSLKQADINFIKQHYNLDVNDDEADAICIGYSVTQQDEEPKTQTIDDFEFR